MKSKLKIRILKNFGLSMRTMDRGSGMTILELIVAMAISGIVVSLIFASNLNVTKGFLLQINKSAQIMQMSMLKKQLDRLAGKVGVVISVRETALEYQDKDTDSLHIISFSDRTLKKDSFVIGKSLDGFAWSIQQPILGSGKAVLYWEAIIGTGWVGGASEVVNQ
jgi:prepilin-type N-terminal cleavage/methylation domain-containing protein